MSSLSSSSSSSPAPPVPTRVPPPSRRYPGTHFTIPSPTPTPLTTINIDTSFNLYDVSSHVATFITSHHIIRCNIGNDNNIYVFGKEKQQQQQAHDDEKLYHYRTIILHYDWEQYKLISHRIVDLGIIPYTLHFIQPLTLSHDTYLLVGQRCKRYDDGKMDHNAYIVKSTHNTETSTETSTSTQTSTSSDNPHTHIIRSMCLGDAISQVIVDVDDTIIVSYYDEGIYGNNGWGYSKKEDGTLYRDVEPIGRYGINRFNIYGEIIWHANEKYHINHINTIQVDANNHLWFICKDKQENIVHTDYINDTTYQVPYGEISSLAFMPILPSVDNTTDRESDNAINNTSSKSQSTRLPLLIVNMHGDDHYIYNIEHQSQSMHFQFNHQLEQHQQPYPVYRNNHMAAVKPMGHNTCIFYAHTFKPTTPHG